MSAPTALAPTQGRSFKRWTSGTPRVFVMSFVLLSCFLMSSCGGGGGGSGFYTGLVDVHNEGYSSDVVVGVDFFGRNGAPDYSYNTSLFPGESLLAEVATGRYDVDVYWSTGSIDTFFNVRVDLNATTFIDVAN